MDVEIVEEADTSGGGLCLHLLQEPREPVHVAVSGVVGVSDGAGPVFWLVSKTISRQGGYCSQNHQAQVEGAKT